MRTILFLLALLVTSRVTRAQQAADVVRGRVVDDSNHVVVGATIVITRGPDRLVQQTTTDTTGRYASRFENGTGDYLVAVNTVGLKSARRRVQRVGTERELVADFILGRELATLATVKVKGDKPVRATTRVSPYDKETGASESWSDGVKGQVTPSLAGDLNALAGTIPGITITSSGPSMLGAPSSSNLTTLNGMALAGGSLPRAARTDTRVTGATFDPTRGGFSGANIDVQLAAGSRSYQQRNAYLTFDTPPLQTTDAIGRSLGVINRGFRASVGADGELIREALTYNVALDVSQYASDPSTLLSADFSTFQRAGVASDSVARLLQLARIANVPVSGNGVPSARTRNGFSWLGRLDDTRDSLRTLTLTTYASRNDVGAIGAAPLTAPAASGKSQDQSLGVQLMQSAYLGAGHFVLMQNNIAFSHSSQRTTPYVALPGASVLVRSTTDAGTTDGATLTLGGAPYLATDDARWTAEASDQIAWFARGSKHRFKSLVWLRADGVRQSGIPNAAGNYTYSSLADFAANQPSSYARTLAQPARSADAYNGALAVAHQWNQSRWFSVLYGARVEASTFGNAPPVNSALDAALGTHSGVAPSRIHLSPRLGFSYTYSRAKDNGNGQWNNQLGTFYRSMMGFVRGGIGEFRDLVKPGTLADAVAGSGLVGSTLTLSCVGAAVPIPDWNSLDANTASLPSNCVGDSGALSQRAPSVTLIDRSFDVPRSWRASLGWATNVNRWTVKVDGLASYDLSQPSTLDANFTGVQRLALASENNRPVYVSTAAIDANSGFVSSVESRRSSDFGRVALRTSDLRGYGGQITTTLAPDPFRLRGRVQFFSALSYTLQGLRQQFRGFDGATFGDPRVTEWAVGNNEARHAFVVQGGVTIPHVGSITLFTRVQSGMPFTPLVQGDINGDGRANDRALVPSTSSKTDAVLATQMRALLSGAPSNVRECLQQQMGAVAARNSCRGAWTQAMTLQFRPQLPFTVQGHDVVANIALQNPLAGLDQLVHGSASLRGWGTSALPDPVLLIPRGFDANAQRFRYDINPRFGDTRAIRTLTRDPFRVSIDFSVNLSTPYDVQQLRRAIEPVRTRAGWERRSVDSLMAFYLRNTSNLHRLILAESDSLFLTSEQVGKLIAADSAYASQVRAIYRPLSEFLVTVPTGAAGKAALDTANTSDTAYWVIFWNQVDVMMPILTTQQRELLPLLKSISEVTTEQRKHSQWQFGYPIPVVQNKPRVGSN